MFNSQQQQELSSDRLLHHARMGLEWLRQSHLACGEGGLAHSYSLWKGWEKAYPETTGYAIPTLLHWSEQLCEKKWEEMARVCSDWLETQQLPSGAFPGLLEGSEHPSIFNTTQILFGLQATGKEQAIFRALDWINSTTEADGSWKQAAYVPGFQPSYYTRGVWAVLSVLESHSMPELREKMACAVALYKKRMLGNGAVSDWGFWPGKPAYTHTIAYTLNGLWGCTQYLPDPEITDQLCTAADAMWQQRQARRKWPGSFKPDWSGNYRFACLTGHAQLSIFYSRLFEDTGNNTYKMAAQDLLQSLLKYQQPSGESGIKGGLSGSAPIWGRYMRFRYPNWGIKFFLDAIEWELGRQEK
ncbi:MAG: hypothetical protein R2792_18235 [Saprospiraceae bacterium]